MEEEYREYRRRRTANADKTPKRIAFPKKLGYQTVISLALLIAVCALKFSAEESVVNTYIKDAVLYQPDTSEVTDILGNLINYNTKEGTDNEENNIPENL